MSIKVRFLHWSRQRLHGSFPAPPDGRPSHKRMTSIKVRFQVEFRNIWIHWVLESSCATRPPSYQCENPTMTRVPIQPFRTWDGHHPAQPAMKVTAPPHQSSTTATHTMPSPSHDQCAVGGDQCRHNKRPLQLQTNPSPAAAITTKPSIQRNAPHQRRSGNQCHQ